MKKWWLKRQRTETDSMGIRHTKREFVIRADGEDKTPMVFDTEREAKAAAGMYNATDRRGWHYFVEQHGP